MFFDLTEKVGTEKTTVCAGETVQLLARELGAWRDLPSCRGAGGPGVGTGLVEQRSMLGETGPRPLRYALNEVFIFGYKKARGRYDPLSGHFSCVRRGCYP